MGINLLLLCLLIYNLTSCGCQNKGISFGIVRVKIQIFDTITTPLLKPLLATDYRIWYKDSLVIEEIKLIRFMTDTAGKKSTDVTVTHYTFVDLKSKSFYDYKNFSDSAGMVKKYSQPDSIPVNGGWNFYFKRDVEYIGSPQIVDDTIMSEIRYKRVKFNTQKGKNVYISIGYFRCDKIGSMFKFDYSYSDKMGCPLVKIDEFPVTKGNRMGAEIDFISDTLSEKELKVFDSWEKNEKKYPVR